METLYHQTNRLVDDVQHAFARLEHCSQQEAHVLENEVQAIIDQITSNCERLDILVLKEPPVRRPNAKLRVDQLKYSCQHLQAALRNLQHRRYIREEEQKEREQLLSRKFTPNDQDTSIYIDQALQQNTSLNNAHRGMDELLGTGYGILGSIRDQRQTLKGAHRKILDVANTLGLSNTVMRLIEKRTYQDKFVLFGGMVVTCIIMFLIVRYMYFS